MEKDGYGPIISLAHACSGLFCPTVANEETKCFKFWFWC